MSLKCNNCGLVTSGGSTSRVQEKGFCPRCKQPMEVVNASNPFITKPKPPQPQIITPQTPAEPQQPIVPIGEKIDE